MIEERLVKTVINGKEVEYLEKFRCEYGKEVEDKKPKEENLNKAYDQYKASGESKLNQTNQEKDSEEASLKEEVNSIEAQIRELTNTLNIKKGELDSIGGKYKSKLESISLKLDANKIAKTKLISEINKVITNINNNI